MGSILEKFALAFLRMVSAALGEVGVDSTPEAVVRTSPKLASGGKALGLARSLRKMACAGPEEAAVGNILETPVQK